MGSTPNSPTPRQAVHHDTLISSAEQIAALVQELHGQDRIAFDTEFIRENTFYPMIELIQVATREQSWLIDARAFKKGYRPGPKGGYDPGIQPLLDVFRDPKILKILHAAQGDQECLHASFGIVAHPTLDTAVAASLCGLGDSIGLGRLLKEVLDVDVKKGHSRTHWGVRPLPQALLDYAHADVDTLVELADRLTEELQKRNRLPWALELTAKWEDPKLYDTDLEEWSHRLARGARLDGVSAAVLRELLVWREKRVRDLNLPRRWVADDAVLVDLAKVKPKDAEHLAAFRGLNKGELKNGGRELLEAVARGVANPGQNAGRQRSESPTPAEAQVIDLLQCYIGFLANQHRVAPKHLLTTAQLLPLLRRAPHSVEQAVVDGVLSPEAARLVGTEILAMIRGERALRIGKRGVEVITPRGEES